MTRCPDADGVQVNCTWESCAAAPRQNLGGGVLGGGEHGPLGAAARMRACAPAAMPPATIAGPPTIVAARHTPASARSHGPRRRRRVSLGNLDSSTFRPPRMSFIKFGDKAMADDTQPEP